MEQPREFIDAEVVILSPEDGGRATPLPAAAYQGQYRPHIVLQSRDVRQAKIEMRDGHRHVVDDYLGVAFWNGPHPVPISTPFTVTLLLMYPEHPAYDSVIRATDQNQMRVAACEIQTAESIASYGKGKF